MARAGVGHACIHDVYVCVCRGVYYVCCAFRWMAGYASIIHDKYKDVTGHGSFTATKYGTRCPAHEYGTTPKVE